LAGLASRVTVDQLLGGTHAGGRGRLCAPHGTHKPASNTRAAILRSRRQTFPKDEWESCDLLSRATCSLRGGIENRPRSGARRDRRALVVATDAGPAVRRAAARSGDPRRRIGGDGARRSSRVLDSRATRPRASIRRWRCEA